MNIEQLLNDEIKNRNSSTEISEDKPDPLLIAREQNHDLAILTCALFSYGNAKQIVKFLKKLPFHLIDRPVNEKNIRDSLEDLKYRFQSNEDIVQWFLLLQKIRQKEKEIQQHTNALNNSHKPKESFLKNKMMEFYQEDHNIVNVIQKTIFLLHSLIDYESRGLNFLIGSNKPTNSPLKRWNMFLRWMVRKDNIDLGYWENDFKTSDLVMPLDTHTFNLGKKFKLISRKSYDLKAAIELTNSLKKFDENDPLKYDFALYRIGQERLSI